MIDYWKVLSLLAVVVLACSVLAGVYFLIRYLSYFRSGSIPQNANAIPGAVQANPQSQVNMTNSPKGIYFYLFLLIQIVSTVGLFVVLIFNGANGSIQKNAGQNSETTSKTSKSSSLPSPTPLVQYSPTRAISKDVQDKFLWPMLRFEKDILVRSEMSNTYTGTIKSINFHNYADEGDLLLRFVFQAESGVENFFGFIKKDVLAAKVVDASNSKEVPMDVHELKVGDKLEIMSVIDMLGVFPNNRKELTIKKIE